MSISTDCRAAGHLATSIWTSRISYEDVASLLSTLSVCVVLMRFYSFNFNNIEHKIISSLSTQLSLRITQQMSNELIFYRHRLSSDTWSCSWPYRWRKMRDDWMMSCWIAQMDFSDQLRALASLLQCWCASILSSQGVMSHKKLPISISTECRAAGHFATSIRTSRISYEDVPSLLSTSSVYVVLMRFYSFNFNDIGAQNNLKFVNSAELTNLRLFCAPMSLKLKE